jgi:hypothetical protein
MMAAINCLVTFQFECSACGEKAYVHLRSVRADPFPAPERHLPERWYVLQGYPVCPAHTLRLEDVPEGRS